MKEELRAGYTAKEVATMRERLVPFLEEGEWSAVIEAVLEELRE